PSFFRFPFLSAADKFAIARALMPLTLTAQRDTGQPFEQWLERHGQTQRAIDRFWKPILVSALSEDLELISISYAAQVVRESMKSPEARHMGVPAIPLTDLYNRAGEYIRVRKGEIRFRNSVEAFAEAPSQIKVRTGDGEENFESLILALPFENVERVLPQTPEAAPLRENLSHFEHAPITG